MLYDARYCFTNTEHNTYQPELFDERYSKRPAELTTEFSRSEYTIDVTAEGKSLFSLRGEVTLNVKSSIASQNDDFGISVDSFQLD